ncbi:hypothetical protein [Clostridium oceanicum]|uniref:Cyclic lactone autoinducer peptide n=1 Tax=Clostridium oceanicum TaxID=1543 RepID=A0ABP3UIP5_9CLOT
MKKLENNIKKAILLKLGDVVTGEVRKGGKFGWAVYEPKKPEHLIKK